MKQRRLGRGLEALLGRPSGAEGGEGWSETESVPIRQEDAGADDDRGLVWVDVYEIDRNPFQPRKHFDDVEIQQLAESIGEHGMLQPIVVRRANGRFQLISGERRWRAATVAGWEKVPTQVWEADDRQMAELAIVENLQRKDLSPLEKGASFQQYIEQFNCTQDELSNRLKVDRSTIANLIRLLELPESVQQALQSGELSAGHARALLPLGDEREQTAFAKRILAEGLSVRAVEDMVKSAIDDADGETLAVVNPDAAPGKPRRTRTEQISSLEQELRSAIGARVEIRQNSKGRGKIILHFKNPDDFERLRLLLSGAVLPQSQAG